MNKGLGASPGCSLARSNWRCRSSANAFSAPGITSARLSAGAILDAAVAQIVRHLGPELGTLVGLKPQAENVARAVRQDRQCYEDRLVRHRDVTADIDPDPLICAATKEASLAKCAALKPASRRLPVEMTMP